MKSKKTMALLTAISMSFATAAHSTAVFNYSYTFSSGWVAYGTLSGDQVGSYIGNISDVTLNFQCQFPTCLGPNSTFLNTPMTLMGWNYTTHFWDQAVVPVVSLSSPSLNNFQFINQPNYPPTFDAGTLRYFEMHAVDPAYPYDLPSVSAQDYSVSRGDGGSVIGGSWSIVAVYEPDTVSMFGVGLVGLAIMRRRKAS